MMTTIESLRDSLPTRDDLLHSLGLQYERTYGSYLAALAVFAIGAATGATLALMLAPSSGRELRRDARQRMQSWSERAREQFGTTRDEGEAAERH
jgi:hypothetical protein